MNGVNLLNKKIRGTQKLTGNNQIPYIRFREDNQSSHDTIVNKLQILTNKNKAKQLTNNNSKNRSSYSNLNSHRNHNQHNGKNQTLNQFKNKHKSSKNLFDVHYSEYALNPASNTVQQEAEQDHYRNITFLKPEPEQQYQPYYEDQQAQRSAELHDRIQKLKYKKGNQQKNKPKLQITSTNNSRNKQNYTGFYQSPIQASYGKQIPVISHYDHHYASTNPKYKNNHRNYKRVDETQSVESMSSLNKVQEHYQQIETILEAENRNLQQHNQYLIGVIKKMQDRQNKYKTQNLKLNKMVDKLEKEKQMLQDKVEQIQLFFKNFEQKQEQNNLNNISIKQLPSSNGTINNMPIQQINSTPHLNFRVNFGQEPQTQTMIIPKNIESYSMKETDEEDLEFLNEKFQEQMKKYREEYNHEARKQCIRIARKIKELKNKKGKDSLSNPKIQPNLSSSYKNLKLEKIKQNRGLQNLVNTLSMSPTQRQKNYLNNSKSYLQKFQYNSQKDLFPKT